MTTLGSDLSTSHTCHPRVQGSHNRSAPTRVTTRVGTVHCTTVDYDVQYWPGITYQLADGVSRLRVEGASSEPVDEKVLCFAVQWRGEERNPRQGTVHWKTPIDPGEADHAFAVVPEECYVSSVTVEEFLREQAEDPFCRALAETVGNPDSRYEVDRYGFLVR